MFYKRSGDKNDSYVNSTTSPNERKLHISGLEKFAAYSVKVLAFTRKGDGAVSINISVLTDEDGRLFKFLSVNILPLLNYKLVWGFISFFSYKVYLKFEVHLSKRDALEGLHSFRQFSQLPECIDEAM